MGGEYMGGVVGTSEGCVRRGTVMLNLRATALSALSRPELADGEGGARP